MPRLLLVTHRSPHQDGGAAARWRAMLRHLPAHGWTVEVLSAVERIAGDEYRPSPAARRQLELRARVTARVGALADPAFGVLGVRPEAFPLSMAWVPRASLELRRRISDGGFDVVLATGPPTAALLAARAGRRRGDPPLVVELRDLWAGNPLFDRRGGLLTAVESWVLGAASSVVTMTPEAAADVRRRHPRLADRVVDIPNGFDGDLLARRSPVDARRPIEILHSGTLTVDRPLAPLLRVLARDPYRETFRLVLHGYLAPTVADEIASMNGGPTVEVVAPSGWEEAVARIARADVTLVTQAGSAGDATAVASKVYEYLALGRPVLCLSAGGATEAVLRRLGADRYCARLDDEASLAAARARLRAQPLSSAVPAELLAPYDRATLAGRMAELLDDVVSRSL
jgi:glycosyltransferase involved in cell wall biosynthesis